jgi:hypothetical protein
LRASGSAFLAPAVARCVAAVSVSRPRSFGGRLLRAILALEGLVSDTLAELLDTVDLLRLEAVEGLLLLVSANVRVAILEIVEVGAPFGGVWAA